MREYDEAIPYLKRYIEAEPTDPNPHDSLAEILQKAGRLEESLAEYREALKLDPKFYSSQKAIGDDYALLGDQERARQEYAKALPLGLTPQDRLDCQIQSAITFARENDRKRTRTELAIVLEQATKLNLNDYQSAIHRYLALLAESSGEASQQLDQAEAVLEKAGQVSGARRNSVLANTLRTRARLASEDGKLDVARAAVSHLQRMLQTNRSNAIERAYHGANGALLAAESKTGAAIEELSEDSEYPFSESKRAKLLASSGNEREAAKIRTRLKADYGTSLEDWLVVRGLRQ
jgi:tetratricopeptide (TPR) repeat protein